MADYSPPAPRLQQQDLAGKLALVTGATKGIGRAIALDLATRGCSIIGTYSSPESAHLFDVLSKTVSGLYSSSNTSGIKNEQGNTPIAPSSALQAPKMIGLAANIQDLNSVETILAVIPNPSSLSILVLSATLNIRPTLGTASATQISSILNANLSWPITLVEHLVSSKTFAPNSRIVAISSDRVRDPLPGTSLFNATKTGLESLARSWAVEIPLHAPGSTVNAVSVGLTDTPGLRSFGAEAVEKMKATRVPKVKVVPGGRLGYSEDVADVVGWLVSEKARWVTGSVIAANGGAEWVGGSS